MANKMKFLAAPAGPMTQAVSDGELNVSRSSGTGSSLSLNNTSAGGEAPCVGNPASRVVGWAVCFERLLEDAIGVHYFTAFLKSEVSAENILFWQACEKFQKIPSNNLDELKKEARAIYEKYLSENSFHAVNIDDTARTNESDLDKPTPDMFNKAQQQIFKLMKFDSYARFVRSPLYQSCMLASVEGQPLPQLDYHKNPVSPTNDGKHMSVKELFSDGKALKKKVEKRGSWGDVTFQRISLSRQESQTPSKSSSNSDLGSISNKSESGSMSPTGSGLDSPGRVDKYCCVFLPDGTASLIPARPGLLLRDMLSGLCEKRGFPMNDIIIYFHGKDKNVCPRQQPLLLDQDSAILQDQQVSLELRVTFKLEIAFTQKTIVIVAKSSKTLADALSSVLQKHQLRTQDILVTVSGSEEPLDMNTRVFSLINKALCLDRVKSSGSTEMKTTPVASRVSTTPKKPHEIDGLVDMLTRAQCSRADDQRGLLTKEQLELPRFLQLPKRQSEKRGDELEYEIEERSSSIHTQPATTGGDEEEPCHDNPKDSNEERDQKRT